MKLYRRSDVLKARDIEEEKLKMLTDRLIDAYGRNKFITEMEDVLTGRNRMTDDDIIKDLESAVRVARANIFAYDQILTDLKDE